MMTPDEARRILASGQGDLQAANAAYYGTGGSGGHYGQQASVQAAAAPPRYQSEQQAAPPPSFSFSGGTVSSPAGTTDVPRYNTGATIFPSQQTAEQVRGTMQDIVGHPVSIGQTQWSGPASLSAPSPTLDFAGRSHSAGLVANTLANNPAHVARRMLWDEVYNTNRGRPGTMDPPAGMRAPVQGLGSAAQAAPYRYGLQQPAPVARSPFYGLRPAPAPRSPFRMPQFTQRYRQRPPQG